MLQLSLEKYTDFLYENFVTYAEFDTQSDPNSGQYPSTAKQTQLLLHLKAQMESLGLTELSFDGLGVIMATLPANTDKDIPTIGFLAHVDTSPEMSGTNVRPVLHKNYDGTDLVLEHATIPVDKNPKLKDHIGEDIITSQGDTLLGADDKSGIAAIITAVRYLLDHPEIEHGKIRIAFTPDEEIGQGTDHFDVNLFNAYCAYTIDGSTRGEIEDETFCADGMVFNFHGTNTHPGSAYEVMVNSMKAASHFVASLPHDKSPEGTQHTQGFVHPYDFVGTVDKSTVTLILRDFVEENLELHKEMLLKIAEKAVEAVPGSSFTFTHTRQYRNMKVILDQYPEVTEIAKKAILDSGLQIIQNPVRGGTDGAQLSFMGLPTPNIFNGAHNFHSRYEWVSLQDMVKAAEVVVRISNLWAYRENSR